VASRRPCRLTGRNSKAAQTPLADPTKARVRLARDNIGRPSPRLTSIIYHSVGLKSAIIRTAGVTATSEGTCADCAVGIAASVRGLDADGLWHEAERPRNRAMATTLRDFDTLTQLFAHFNNDDFAFQRNVRI
jgi:hypothetical protein